MVLLVIIFALIFTAGYATQRGSVCAVAAIHQIVSEHRSSQLLGLLFCAASALAAMVMAGLVGIEVINRHQDLPIGLTTIAGGMVFALGAHINGKCAFGTVAALGAGDLAYAATIMGFLVGVGVMFAGGVTHPWDLVGRVSSPLLALNAAVAAALALVLVFGLATVLWHRGGRTTRPGGWSSLKAMAVIGLVNATLLMLAQDWPYTRLLIDLVGAHAEAIPRRTVMTAIFVLGSVAGALAAGHFTWQFGAPSRWLRTTLGGFVMGMGAVLIPGGNDAMLMVGVPLLLPNLTVAYLVTIGTLYALAVLSGRWSSGAIRWPLRKGPA